MKKSTRSSTGKPATFVDTSGFYALLVDEDRHHARARALLLEAERARRVFVTTDYVIDETATLLRGRKESASIPLLFQTLQNSKACQMVWMDPDRLQAAQRLFLSHADKAWSFTDCSSFVIMRELGLREALTSDHHFEQAKFTALLG